jgi:hypothetical protein
MKKLFLLMAGIATSGSMFGQWSGTNPEWTLTNVGIGTTTPVTALTIQTAATNNGLRIIQTGTTASAMGLFNSSAGAHNWALFSTGSGNIQGAGNFSIYDYTAARDRFFIQGTTGNVGIGTTNPQHKLHVHDGLIRVTGTNSFGGPMIVFGDSPTSPNNGTWGIEYVPAANGSPGLNFWKPWPSVNSGNYYMFLSDNGRVGINTNNPTAQLTVNGNMVVGDPNVVCIPNANYKLFVQTGILTEKVKVAVNCSANWADYVFDENYCMNSLEEIEAYVAENKHLPNIPSADEMVANGLDVATMDAKLLEKIEELTLHLIQMNKRMAELEKQNAELTK